jgi:hypothetical protein
LADGVIYPSSPVENPVCLRIRAVCRIIIGGGVRAVVASRCQPRAKRPT